MQHVNCVLPAYVPGLQTQSRFIVLRLLRRGEIAIRWTVRRDQEQFLQGEIVVFYSNPWSSGAGIQGRQMSDRQHHYHWLYTKLAGEFFP